MSTFPARNAYYQAPLSASYHLLSPQHLKLILRWQCIFLFAGGASAAAIGLTIWHGSGDAVASRGEILTAAFSSPAAAIFVAVKLPQRRRFPYFPRLTSAADNLILVLLTLAKSRFRNGN